MLNRHKKMIKYYFSDATLWFYGTVGLVLAMVIAFGALLITEGAGDVSDMVKPLVTVAIFLYALYSGRGIIKFRHNCMKDLKNGEIETKNITVARFGGDGRHNIGILGRRKPMGKIKYAFIDTDGIIYYMVRGKKNLLPDDAVVGRKMAVTYLKNTRLVLELGFGLKDDMDSSLDNFKAVFPQYFERSYD